MFPDVRLLIAATMASVLALICGFGLFAVFRVSHDPLMTLPPASSVLRLVADKSARLPVAFAQAETFDQRFHLPAPAEPAATAPQAAAATAEDEPARAAMTEPEIAPGAADVTSSVLSPELATAEAGHESDMTAASDPVTGGGEVADARKITAAETPPVDSAPPPSAQKPADRMASPRPEQIALAPIVGAVDQKRRAKPTRRAANENKASDQGRKTWHIGASTVTPRRVYKVARAAPVRAAQIGDLGQGTFGLALQPTQPAVRKRVVRVRAKTPDTNAARAPAKAQETNVAHVPARTQESKAAPTEGIGGPFVSPPPDAQP